jgi:tripartite-type tricarboxylate transporter receptor subunit TctC
LNYGHLGPGSPHYFVMEWFKQAAKIDLLAVPYRGAAPAYAALVAGEVQVVASGLGAATPFLENGQARAIAAISSTRPVSRPDLPTIAELGFAEFDLTSWMGVFVKAGTSGEIVTKLQDEIISILADPAVAERLTKIGLQPTPQRAGEFGAFVGTQVKAWERIVKATGAKVE